MNEEKIIVGNKLDGEERSGPGVGSVPNRGIASDTCGRVSATRLRNTVSDRRIVTPVIKHKVNAPTAGAMSSMPTTIKILPVTQLF